LKGGVKCIEHGFYLDDECIEIMLKKRLHLCAYPRYHAHGQALF
jgi:imidazolonepropionase-like amidohydrolase